MSVPDEAREPDTEHRTRRRAYVALLGPDGSHLSSMLYGQPGDDLQALTVDPCNHSLVAGANKWSAPNHLFVGRLP